MVSETTSIAAPQTELRYSQVLSYGAQRGDYVMTNDELVKNMDSSDEWIQRRTGIKERRFASKDVSLVDMAVGAGREAIDKSGIDPAKITTVILATCSAPVQNPSMATLVAERLGINPAAAYDSSSACSGYTYAIAQADGLIRSGISDYVLVIGADKMTDIIDLEDRSTAIIFADGAGASLLGVSETPGISKTVWGSDGSKWDLIGMTSTHSEFAESNGELARPALRQEGPSVYRWAVWEMAKIGKRTIEEAGLQIADIAAFIPHQANVRIINELASQIGLSDETIVARDVITSGNTSGGTIPLATHRILEENPELSGKLALQLGFGAGLAYAAQIIRLP
jgi:3-oxoacyl-[acyl-carrier-protein] synthase-3